MYLLTFLLLGVAVGSVSRWIMSGPEAAGWTLSIVIGVLGSLLGGFLGRALGVYGDGHATGFLMSVFGAVLLLSAYQATARRERPT